MNLTNLTSASPEFKFLLEQWHEERNLARTDLLWLCNEVLGYTLICRKVHGPILDALQHFYGAVERHKTVEDFLAARAGKVLWEPVVQMELLPANSEELRVMSPFVEREVVAANAVLRQVLVLFPRGHAKSTLATVAHTIQWILNYPNVRVMITTATEDLVTTFIKEIREHFKTNEKLRYLFPEFCQPVDEDSGKIPELGNQSGFTIRCRDNANKALGPGGREATVWAGTVGTAATGGHPDVEKCDDLVEKINSSSLSGIVDVIRHFGALGDLLEKYVTKDGPRPGWVDVVGTPWDYSDLYQVLRDSEEKRRQDGLPPTWMFAIRSATPLGNWPDPAGPFLWPEKMGYAELKKIEDDVDKGPGQLSAQYLMDPIVPGTGLISDVKNLRWTSDLEMNQSLAGANVSGRLDLAGMDPNAKGLDNDYSALSVGGMRDGTLLLAALWHGRPDVAGVVEWIFEAFKQFPQMTRLVVEKASGASPLESWLRREMSERGLWLQVEFVSRSNQQSKQSRIKGMQAWFGGGRVILGGRLKAHRTMIEKEIKGFPKYRHDDILDTWSDFLTDSKGEVRAGVMVDGTSDVPQRDTISMLLAAAGVEDYAMSGFDRDTGFPC